MIEIVGAHRMRVQLEAGEVRHPRRARPASRGTTSSARAARRKLQRHDVDPRRPRLGRALLEEELAVDAVRIAHEHVRPAARAAQRAVGDREVVVHEIEFRVPGAREEHLLRVGDRHLAPADLMSSEAP